MLLHDATAVTNLAVKDLARARKFYEGTLGLEPEGEMGEEVVTYKSGSSQSYVYGDGGARSRGSRTRTATSSRSRASGW